MTYVKWFIKFYFITATSYPTAPLKRFSQITDISFQHVKVYVQNLKKLFNHIGKFSNSGYLSKSTNKTTHFKN